MNIPVDTATPDDERYDFGRQRGFKGARRTWGTIQYVGDAWNDKISSVYVRCG